MSPLTRLLLLCDVMLLCCADSSQPSQDQMAPLQVIFHSVNFRNVLHWKRHPSTPRNSQYFVQYKIYGDKLWTPSKLCQGLRKLQCDLSQETSDPREWYYARVQSLSSKGLSAWAISSRFYPQWDTSYSPPRLKLNVTEKGITIRIIPPTSPLRGDGNTRISVTKLQRLRFRIYLVHNGTEEKVHETGSCSKKVVIQNVRPSTIYCFRGVTVMPLSGSTSSRGPQTCVSTPEKQKLDFMVKQDTSRIYREHGMSELSKGVWK